MIQSESKDQVSDSLWGDDEIAKMVSVAARKATGRFHGYVELQDMMQEGWLAVSSTSKLRDWQSQGQAGKSRLFRWILKCCLLYGQKEKAAKLGYKPSDLFFYGMRTFREIIPAVLESWSGGDAYEYEYPDRAIWLDVSTALTQLSESDYQMIWWAFKGDPDEEQGNALVASKLSISVDAARQRVDRVLRRMQESLGGENPMPRKSRKSNAQALAEIRNAWEGEG